MTDRDWYYSQLKKASKIIDANRTKKKEWLFIHNLKYKTKRLFLSFVLYYKKVMFNSFGCGGISPQFWGQFRQWKKESLESFVKNMPQLSKTSHYSLSKHPRKQL